MPQLNHVLETTKLESSACIISKFSLRTRREDLVHFPHQQQVIQSFILTETMG